MHKKTVLKFYGDEDIEGIIDEYIKCADGYVKESIEAQLKKGNAVIYSDGNLIGRYTMVQYFLPDCDNTSVSLEYVDIVIYNKTKGK